MDIEKKIKKNVLLKDLTTFRIGGKTKYFLEAGSKEEVSMAVQWAQEKGVPFFVLGAGSNTLVSDRKFNGLVIKVQSSKFKVQSYDEKPIVVGKSEPFKVIETEAGVPLGKIVGLALQNNLTGMEWAMGIPGTVGGAIYGNAGAFGKIMGDAVEEVNVIDIFALEYSLRHPERSEGSLNRDSSAALSGLRMTDAVRSIKKEECGFGYRESIFKHNKNLIILSAKIKLKTGDKAEIEKKMKEYFQKKKQTQPLEYFSVGSIFKNQELGIKNQELLEKFPELKQFKEKKVIPAAWLIEKCGLKGKQIGKAQISNKHSNFIVNMANAKAKDVKKLIDLIKKTVKKKFIIDLEEEIQYLNF